MTSISSIRLLAKQLASISSAALLAAIAVAPSRALASDACSPSSSIVYSPAQGSPGMVMFEDSWPNNGDLDFNDQVIAYSYEYLLDASGNVVTLKANFSVLASGAVIHNGAYLHLPLARTAGSPTVLDQNGNTVLPIATETDFVLPIVADTRTLFYANPFANDSFLDTNPLEAGAATTSLSFTITYATGVALDHSQQPFDLFIATTPDFGLQIHLPQYAGTNAMHTALFDTHDDRSTATRHFINENGLPFALVIPEIIAWPKETLPLDDVYPNLTTFGTSGGTSDTNWYVSDYVTADAYTHDVNGNPPPAPQEVGAELSCSSVTYTPSTLTCIVDAPCSLSAPSNSGIPTTYSVSPALPSGLNINANSGAISGAASAVSASASYTVQALNSAGAASTIVTVVVNAAPAVVNPNSIIASGYYSTCAIENGDVWCWGDNSMGELGDGTSNNSLVPVKVVGLPGPAQSISAGWYFTCALVSGSVWCWGDNGYNQLGNSTLTNSSTPVQVPGVSGVTALSAGEWHTCAVANGGAICWGDNGEGECGTGSLGETVSDTYLAPNQVVGLPPGSGVQGIAAGGYFTCAIVNGGVQCWGYGADGEMDNGTRGQNNLLPTQSSFTSGVQQIVAGEASACALVAGVVKCWGLFGNLNFETSPVAVTSISGTVLAIAEGSTTYSDHACALLSTGIECWGANDWGELGNNSVTDATWNKAFPVVGIGSGVESITAGTSNACAVVNGSAECWGADYSGQLGNNDATLTESNVPVTVVGLSGL